MLRNLIIGLILFGCLSALTLAEITQEKGTDRPGMDIKNILLDTPDPSLCGQACLDTEGCKAYTYVQPGVQDTKANCWLKNEVPDPVPRDDCVSGVVVPEVENTSSEIDLYQVTTPPDQNSSEKALNNGKNHSYIDSTKVSSSIRRLIPDLTFSSVKVPQEATSGDDVPITIVVKNIGTGLSHELAGSIGGKIQSNKQIDVGNGLYIQPQALFFVDSFQIPAMNPGEAKTIDYILKNVSEGGYEVGVSVNLDKATQEKDYTNNEYGQVTMIVQDLENMNDTLPLYQNDTFVTRDDITIIPGLMFNDSQKEIPPILKYTAYPDLTISKITVPATVATGQKFPVQIEVKNIGLANAAPSKGIFITETFESFMTRNPDGTATLSAAQGILPFPGFPYSSSTPFFSIPALAQGATTTVTIQEGPYTPGKYSKPGACVNINKAIVESDYTNNNLSTSDIITVGSPPDVSPDPSSGPTGTDVASLVEKAIFTYTNAERAKVGKPPYVYDAELSKVSRSYSQDRLTNNYEPSNHIDKAGRDPTARAIAAGYQIPTRTWTGGCTKAWVGENQAYMSGYSGTPDQIGKQFVTIWMGSSGHKAAIIDDPAITGVGVCNCNGNKASCGFQKIGVGVAVQGSTYKATEDFV